MSLLDIEFESWCWLMKCWKFVQNSKSWSAVRICNCINLSKSGVIILIFQGSRLVQSLKLYDEKQNIKKVNQVCYHERFPSSCRNVYVKIEPFFIIRCELAIWFTLEQTRLNPTWVHLRSKGTRRTPSSRTLKLASTWYVSRLAPRSV